MLKFARELKALEKNGLNVEGRIFISDRAHVVLDLMQKVDGLEEVELGAGLIGTTKKGIGPTYSSKAHRSGIRIADIFHDDVDAKIRRLASGYQKRFGDLLEYDVEEEITRLHSYREPLAGYVIDQIPFLKSAKQQKANILVEGANAVMLDIDYGTYPFVTSSNTGMGGVISGLTLGWQSIKEVIGVVKAYTTRVGSGPFPTELHDADGDKLQTVGREVGVTTGRKRRCGWLDLVLVQYSHEVNNYTAINLTKLDILDTFPEIKVAVKYVYKGDPLESFPADLHVLSDDANFKIEYKAFPGWQTSTVGAKSYGELPENARKYIEFIEGFIGVPVVYIGTGPARESMLVRSHS